MGKGPPWERAPIRPISPGGATAIQRKVLDGAMRSGKPPLAQIHMNYPSLRTTARTASVAIALLRRCLILRRLVMRATHPLKERIIGCLMQAACLVELRLRLSLPAHDLVEPTQPPVHIHVLRLQLGSPSQFAQ